MKHNSLYKIVNIRQSTSLSTAKSYANRADAAAVAAFGLTETNEVSLKEATAAFHVATSAVFAPMTANPVAKNTLVAPGYPGCFSKNGPPPLEPANPENGDSLDESMGKHNMINDINGIETTETSHQAPR